MMNAFDSRRDRAQLLLTALGIAIAFAVLPLADGLLGVLGLPGILLGPLAISYFFELATLYRREFGPPEVSPPPNDSLAAR